MFHSQISTELANERSTESTDKQIDKQQQQQQQHHAKSKTTPQHVNHQSQLGYHFEEGLSSSNKIVQRTQQFSRPTSSSSYLNTHQIVPNTGDKIEFPRIPTKQATLPIELQSLHTKDVYPNQETSLTIQEKKKEEEEVSKLLSEEKKKNSTIVEKKIVWNRNAPANPFSHAHVYTQEPGAWYD